MHNVWLFEEFWNFRWGSMKTTACMGSRQQGSSLGFEMGLNILHFQWHFSMIENTYRSSSRSWPGGHLLLTQWEACWDGRLPSLRLDRDPETRAGEHKLSFKQTTNYIHSTPTHALFNTKIRSNFFCHYNHIHTSRTCFTTASEAPNRSTPEMPRTSESTAPGDKFFFLRPRSNIYSPTHTGDHLQITQEHPHTREGRERKNIKTATQKHICDIWQ